MGKMCKKCSKIGKMKRKRSRVRGISVASVVPTLQTAALAAVGYYAANKLGGLSFMPSNGYAKAAIKTAIGVGLTMVKNPLATSAGVGIAANGVLTALQEVKAIKPADIAIGQQRTWIAGVDSPDMQPIATFQ